MKNFSASVKQLCTVSKRLQGTLQTGKKQTLGNLWCMDNLLIFKDQIAQVTF